MQGIQDMLLQYLQLVIGFNTADQTVLITVIGGTNFVVQVRHGAWAQPLAAWASAAAYLSDFWHVGWTAVG